MRACVHVQSCLTLCNSMDYSPPGSSVHGISQARTLEWVANFLLQGSFPTQGLSSGLLHLLPQAGGLFTTKPGRPKY